MKLTRNFLAAFLSISLVSVSFLSLAIQSTSAQDSKIALQRGYRTGYSDGYMSGYRDAIDNAVKSFEKHNEYTKADRAYSKEYGSVEDYRDGYQQGFETGYGTGFEKRAFDATIPTDLKKRGIVTVRTQTTTTAPTETVSNPAIITTPTETNAQVSENTTDQTVSTKTENIITAVTQPTVIIPTDTEIIVELLDNINTEQSREGDKFTAKVISPYELTGSIVEGRITKIQKPGKIKRRAQVLLSFDRIVMVENRWSNFNAILTEVLPTKGDNVKRVDNEGTAVGKGSIKDDSIKVGAATGTGLVVGAIVGGPVGAAVGAGLGAAFGVGAVVVERGKHIRLNKNQQLRIKTVYETQIR
jgi:flagellar biosynthesis/type III secretory pathway protein FliH